MQLRSRISHLDGYNGVRRISGGLAVDLAEI
jgi:hypothetical protein